MKRRMFDHKVHVDEKIRGTYFGRNIDFLHDDIIVDERKMFSRNDR